MVASQLPDFGSSIRREGFTIVPMYQGGDRYYFLPTGIKLRKKINGEPEFSLEFFIKNHTDDPDEATYTMIGMGVETQGDLEEALAYLRTQNPRATLVNVRYEPEALWYMESPQAAPLSRPFAWDDAGGARIHRRITEAAGLVVYNGLRAGSLVAIAAIEVRIRGVCPRVRASVRFSPRDLLTFLHAKNGNSATIPYYELERNLTKPEAPPVHVSGSDTIRDTDFAQAMLARITEELGQLVPSPRISDGPHVALKDPSEASLPPEMTWDLEFPYVSVRPLMLDYNPFEEIVHFVSQAGIDKVVYTSLIPPFPSEQTKLQVFVDASVPPNPQDVLAMDVTLRVEPEHAPHNNAVVRTVTLYPHDPARPPAVELSFKRPDPRPYNFHTRVITHSGELSTPRHPRSESYVYIEARELPSFVTVRANSELLEQARIHVTLVREGGEDVSSALDPESPAASFLLGMEEPDDPDEASASLRVVARSPTDAAKTIELTLDARSIALSLVSFPQYGLHRVEVTVELQTSTESAVFEFWPECSADDPIALRFSPDHDKDSFTYFSTRLFEYRYRYRRVDEGAVPSDWSDYMSPADTLVLQA